MTNTKARSRLNRFPGGIGRILVSAPKSSVKEVLEVAEAFGTPILQLGEVTRGTCSVKDIIDVPVATLMEGWGGALERRLVDGVIAGL